MVGWHRRLSTDSGVLTSGPWARGPLLLLRRPTVFLAIAVATAVLAIAASSGVLFLSTLGTASLRAQAADDCPEASRPALAAQVQPDHLAAENAAGIVAMRRAGALGAPYWVESIRAQIQATPVTFYARAGALDHVITLTPNHGQPGVWFPDDFADKLQVQPGDVIRTADTATPITVAGIYRALSPDPFHLAALPRYWCTWNDLIVQTVTGNATPPFLISDVQTVARVAAGRAAGRPTVPGGLIIDSNGQFVAAGVQVSWYDPIPIDRVSAVTAQRADEHAAAAGVAYLASNPSARSAADPAPTSGAVTGSADPLATKIATAYRVRDGLFGSVVPIDLAGALVALLLVVGAGAFWAAHRSREIALLTARGVGPGALAVKAVLECLPATILGLAGGSAASVALVRMVGPVSTLEPGTPTRAFVAAGGAVIVGLLLIAGLGAFAGRDRTIGAAPTRRRHLPWEVVLIGLAVWAWLRIRGGSGITVRNNIVHVDPVVLLFPLLGATGLLLLVGRLTLIPTSHLTRVAGRTGRAGYLALRRIGGSRAVAVGLLVGTALPCALLSYASTVSAGVHTEVTRKYQTNLGAPDVLQMIGIHNDTPNLHGHGTAVVLYTDGATLTDGTYVSVLGVDPSTFAKFAFTDADERRDVTRLQAAPRTGAAANAIYVHGGSAPPHAVRLGASTVPLHVVARRAVFPGLRSPTDPMLIVNRSVLGTIDPNANRTNEVWTTPGQVAAVSTVAQRAGYSVLGQLDAKIRIGNTGLLPLTWIFGYLRALALLVGAVAVAGLVFALGARTRRRTVSYVMSRRMGLSQGLHLRSLLVELALVVGLGWLIGTVVGLGGYGALVGSLDLYPELPPGAEFGLPVPALAATAAVVVVMIVLASIATHVMAERARPSEILRLE